MIDILKIEYSPITNKYMATYLIKENPPQKRRKREKKHISQVVVDSFMKTLQVKLYELPPAILN